VKKRTGGWAFVVVYEGNIVAEFSDATLDTTNNRMELTAAIEACKYGTMINLPTTICSDSEYVIKGITNWINGWKNNGWKTSAGNDVINIDLWQTLDQVKGNHQWKHVPAHSGIIYNERADALAKAKSQTD
jgi:ribonuclease HI